MIRNLSCIACYDWLFAIGTENKLIYKIPEDLQIFREVTLKHKNMIMGRKTFESLPKVLPQRQHYVLTRELNLAHPDPNVHYINNSEELHNLEDGIVIGGSEIYKVFQKNFKKMYITLVHAYTHCHFDAIFPFAPRQEFFREIYTKELNKFEGKKVTFTIWER